MTKEDAFNFLTISFHPERLCVAAEKHANGNPHLHVYMKLPDALNTRDPHIFDLTHGNLNWHGNYQGCRSTKNVLKYCTKKDDYVADFDVSTSTETASIKKIVSRRVVHDQIPLTELVKEFPELLFGYKRLKQDIEEYTKDIDDQREDLPQHLPNPWGELLDSKIRGKRRHYWVFSREPNRGKTSKFAIPLERDYKVYVKAGDFTYWGFRGDEQALVLDEYNTPALKWSYLNSMCDGTNEYRIFQGGVKKLDRPIIIVLSNKSIEELYPHMFNFLMERFNIIELF